jgi:hypothetical protein
MKNWNRYLINSVNTLCKFCWEISMPKLVGKTFSNQQLGMRVYMKVAMIMELE